MRTPYGFGQQNDRLADITVASGSAPGFGSASKKPVTGSYSVVSADPASTRPESPAPSNIPSQESNRGKGGAPVLAKWDKDNEPWVDSDDPTKPYVPKKPNTRKNRNLSPAESVYGGSDLSLNPSSVHSEPMLNRRAKPKFVTKKHIDTTEFYNVGEQKPRPVSRVCLMLEVGQGGM